MPKFLNWPRERVMSAVGIIFRYLVDWSIPDGQEKQDLWQVMCKRMLFERNSEINIVSIHILHICISQVLQRNPNYVWSFILAHFNYFSMKTTLHRTNTSCVHLCFQSPSAKDLKYKDGRVTQPPPARRLSHWEFLRSVYGVLPGYKQIDTNVCDSLCVHPYL